MQNESQKALLAEINEAIDSEEESTRRIIHAAYHALRKTVSFYGQAGKLALAKLGAELAVEAEENDDVH